MSKSPMQCRVYRHLFVLSFFLFISCAEAIGQSSITGKVVGADSEPVPGANVLLINASDSVMVKGVVTSHDGRYQVDDMGKGSFRLIYSMVGYKKLYSDVIESTGAPVSMPPTVLLEESTELGEVVVEARKPMFEQQMDKMVVNIQNSITSAGNTVLEVLQRSPGITVNKQSNTISLAGRQGLLIMINGKIQRLPMEAIVQMFSGMNANNIERIEIISNPSSKYDAQGDAGIINIVTKQNPDIGTNGSYSLAAGYGFYPKASASFNINHRTQTYSVFADYSYSYNKTWQRFDTQWSNANQGQFTQTESNRDATPTVQKVSAGAEWYVSKKTTLGTLLSAFDDKWEMMAHNTSNVSFYEVPSMNIKLENHEVNQWKNFIGNVNLRHNFSSTRLLTVDADYLLYNDNNPHQYTNQYHYLANDSSSSQLIDIQKKTPITMGVLEIDYEQHISKLKLETGIKTTFSRLNNSVVVQSNTTGEWVVNPKFTQDYAMKDDVLAAYANLFIPINEKTKAQAGLRTEHTDMKIRNDKDELIFNLEFWSLFPSFFVSHQFDKNNAFQFSYGQRITRPSYQDIAPFVIFMDPFTFFSGNPRLQPTMTTNYQGSYTHKELMLTLKYSIDRNYIAQFQTRVDPVDNKTYYYSSNLDRVHSYSAALSVPVKPLKGWEMQNNFLGLYQVITSNYLGEDVKIEQMSGQFNTTNTFTLGKGFAAELTGTYWTPSLFGLSKMFSYGEVTAGLQKKLKDDKGTFRINMGDIFWTNIYRFSTELPNLNLNQQASLYFEPRVVRISFTKNFGSNTVKSGKRTTASDAEQKRVK